jgi:FKBP-type peptidyl-prolyl cis-trans isomerase
MRGASCGIAVLLTVLAAGACLEVRDILLQPSPSPSGATSADGGQNDNDNANESDASNDATSSATGDEQQNTTNDNTLVGPVAPEQNTNGDQSDASGGTATDSPVADETTNGDATTNSETSGIPALPAGARLSTAESGLQYYDYETGVGTQPDITSTVTVDYIGYLPDGTIFDQNDNAQFILTGVVPGFAEGISGMREGGRRRLVIPPDLGYGSEGNPGAGISGTDTIVFDVTLISVDAP